MNGTIFNEERFNSVDFYLRRGIMCGFVFPEAPIFNIYYVPSPQQLPFHLCRGRYVSPREYLFISPRFAATRFQTRNGFYEMTGDEQPIVHPINSRVVGYYRKYRFYYGRPDDVYGPILSTWIVEEYRLNSKNYPNLNPDIDPRFVNLALCKIRKGVPNPAHPSGYIFDVPDFELLDFYLKNNILGKYISGDAIPSFEVFSVPRPHQLPFNLCRVTNGENNEWHFFSHQGPLITENGYYVPSGFSHIHDEDNRLCGYSRTLTYYERTQFGNIRSQLSIEEFRIEPSIVEVEQDDDFTRQLVSDLIVCKVFVNNQD